MSIYEMIVIWFAIGFLSIFVAVFAVAIDQEISFTGELLDIPAYLCIVMIILGPISIGAALFGGRILALEASCREFRGRK